MYNQFPIFHTFAAIFTPLKFDPSSNPQHHDAVTGTEKQNVADDYRLNPFLFFIDNEQLPQFKISFIIKMLKADYVTTARNNLVDFSQRLNRASGGCQRENIEKV